MTKKNAEVTVNGNKVDIDAITEIISGSERPYKVYAATIKDDLCDYTFEILRGIGLDNVHNVKGKHQIKDDMRNAFQVLNVHLAVLDDAFSTAGVEITDIDKHHGDDITYKYRVTGFKIKGSTDAESISLTGTKHSYAAGGRIAITLPFVSIEALSSYTWKNELKDAVEKVREEVALYHEGKYILIEDEVDEDTEIKTAKRKGRSKQLTIASPEAVADRSEKDAENSETEEEIDIEFEGGRL